MLSDDSSSWQARVVQRIFFGKLEAIERETLYDRSWFAVTETCLAMTIFRDEFTTKIFGLFGLLLAVKAFHWLAQMRVEWVRTLALRLTALSALSLLRALPLPAPRTLQSVSLEAVLRLLALPHSHACTHSLA